MKATKIVRWPGKVVYCCERHHGELLGVALAIGLDAYDCSYEGDEVCENCKNEERKRS